MCFFFFELEEFEIQTGIRLDKRKVSLPVEINALGVYIAVVDLHKEVKDEEKGENSQEKINNLLYKQMVIGLEMNTGIIRNNNNPY